MTTGDVARRTKRWRLGWIVKAVLVDTETTAEIELASVELATLVGRGLAAEDAAELPAPPPDASPFPAYDVVRRGDWTYLQRTIGAADGGVVGRTRDETLGRRAAHVLDRLEPRIAKRGGTRINGRFM